MTESKHFLFSTKVNADRDEPGRRENLKWRKGTEAPFRYHCHHLEPKSFSSSTQAWTEIAWRATAEVTMEIGISVPPTFIDSHRPTQLQGRLVPRRGRARIQ